MRLLILAAQKLSLCTQIARS
uniref:Uncharacterized protein n=1 Tax=Anguilla anguilla TaxID=7936 RepID=A0A0E9RHG5_ANGAN